MDAGVGRSRRGQKERKEMGSFPGRRRGCRIQPIPTGKPGSAAVARIQLLLNQRNATRAADKREARKKKPGLPTTQPLPIHQSINKSPVFPNRNRLIHPSILCLRQPEFLPSTLRSPPPSPPPIRPLSPIDKSSALPLLRPSS